VTLDAQGAGSRMFHVKHPDWIADAESLGIDIPTAGWDLLDSYSELLKKIAVPRGMIATGDRDRLWKRHLLDGLRGVIETPTSGRVRDIGSGAGIPGIPMAIVAD